jgi:hypothetical protein
MRRTNPLLLAVGAPALLLAALGLARGQGSDAALKDRVAQLVEKLDAPKAEARDAAQAALIKLGPRILPLLPEPPKSAGAELKARLAKVREALTEQQDAAKPGASMVTIKGQGIRFSEALKLLQSQSGNPITDLRDEPANPALDLDIAGKPFFEALDQIALKAGVAPVYLTGDGTIGLSAAPDAGLPDQIGAEPFKPLVTYAGPFRVAFRRIVAGRDLQDGSASANAEFEVAWEPRLRPMFINLKSDQVEVVDDRGRRVNPSVADESMGQALQQKNPFVEVNVRMDPPARDAKTLARFKVKADVTVPSALRTFRFPSLAAKNVVKAQGDLRVTLEETEVDELVWKVRLRIEMPDAKGPAFESYNQGMFNNRIWLQRSDGSRFEQNGGINSTAAGNGRVGFEYIFVDAPGKPADYSLVYEAPGKVLTIPLEFEFKDVPLP